MKKVICVSIVATFFTILFCAQNSFAQQRKPCDGLTGDTKRKCLVAELERTTREAQAANARLQRLNLQMKRACDAVAVLDKTASIAQSVGEVSQNKPLHFGGMTWTSVRQIFQALTREKQNCESARREVARTRRQ